MSQLPIKYIQNWYYDAAGKKEYFGVHEIMTEAVNSRDSWTLDGADLWTATVNAWIDDPPEESGTYITHSHVILLNIVTSGGKLACFSKFSGLFQRSAKCSNTL